MISFDPSVTKYLKVWRPGLFGVMVLASALTIGALSYLRRVPSGHDTFQYFVLQYYFLNGAVFHGEIPLWMPFMTHGTVANYWFVFSTGLLQSVLLRLGSLLRDFDFLHLFYLNIFVDELVLLTGVWLLSERLFTRRSTVLFVSLAVWGSAIWTLQIWFNFHLYFAMPLILYLGHRFLDTGKWRFLVLAGNLTAFQLMGNLIYFLPIDSLTVFLYFGSYLLLRREEGKALWVRCLKEWRRGVLSLALIFLSFGIVYVALKRGTDSIIHYTPGRLADGSTHLDTFLGYGNNSDWRWSELILGPAVRSDYTLYIGLITFAFFLISLTQWRNRRLLPIFVTGIVLLIFSWGSFLSKGLYYTWPMMKYYRHLSLISPLIKLFLIFAAGFGFEAWLAGKVRRRNLAMVAALFLGFLALHFILLRSPALWNIIAENSSRGAGSKVGPGAQESFNLKWVTPHYINAVCLLILLTFIRRISRPIVVLVLFCHAFAMFTYKFQNLWFDTTRWNSEVASLNRFHAVPFPIRRDEGKTLRYSLLFGAGGPNPFDSSWPIQSYLFADTVDHNRIRADHWLRNLDELIRAVHPRDRKEGTLPFPRDVIAVSKAAGITYDKIQVFRKATWASGQGELGDWLRNPKYAGDQLLLTDTEGNRVSTFEPERSFRLDAPVKILDFSPNRLQIEVDAPKKFPTPWLYWSDVWHPFWSAEVNGKTVPVQPANLAYKAVAISPGKSLITFSFHNQALWLAHWCLSLNGLIWLIILMLMVSKLLWPRLSIFQFI